MRKIVSQLTPEELNRYNPTRNLGKGLDLQRWETAQARLPSLAALLRDQFGATRIMVFGSLVDKGCFTRWSDIDLAVWGIRPEHYYSALEAANEISLDIKVDLINPEEGCSAALKTEIKKGFDI